jgi:hypothetical protein
MIGEGYVVQMLQISESARAVGAEILGEQSEHRQLKKLREPGIVHQLADKLALPEQEIFSRFGERIFAKFRRPALPPFTLYHLRILRDSAPVLARLLDWTADDALKNLLLPEQMQTTLSRINTSWDEGQSDTAELEVGLLLDEILVPNVAKAIEIAYGLGFNDWGTIIESEGWLETEAVDTLRKYAAKRSWPSDDALGILAAILQDMDQGRPPYSEEGERALGWLALTYLRQRLRFLSSRLYNQAIDLAEDAAGKVPSIKSFSYLPAWIKMYEQGAISRAVPYLAPEKQTLSTLLTGQDYKILFRDNAVPAPMEQVLVVKEKTRTKFLSGAAVGSFEVHCVLQGKQDPQAVLGCSDLPPHSLQAPHNGNPKTHRCRHFFAGPVPGTTLAEHTGTGAGRFLADVTRSSQRAWIEHCAKHDTLWRSPAHLDTGYSGFRRNRVCGDRSW